MVIDCDVVAADNFWQLVARECLAVDIDRRVVGTNNSGPDGCQLVVAVEKNSFHDRSSGRCRCRGNPRENVTEVDNPTSVDGYRGPDYMHRAPQHNEVE